MRTADLIDRALQFVDQVGAGQTANANDVARTLPALQAMLAELSALKIVGVAIDPDDLQSDDIPDEIFRVLANLLAADIKPIFVGGMTPEDVREDILNKLRKIVAIGPSYETLSVLHY